MKIADEDEEKTFAQNVAWLAKVSIWFTLSGSFVSHG